MIMMMMMTLFMSSQGRRHRNVVAVGGADRTCTEARSRFEGAEHRCLANNNDVLRIVDLEAPYAGWFKALDFLFFCLFCCCFDCGLLIADCC